MKDCDLVSNLNFNGSTAEEDLYYAFKNDVADKQWFVIHSLPLHESEADFLVFHRELGILLIETKSGNYHTRDGKIFCDNDKDTIDPLKQLKSCETSVKLFLKEKKKE